MEGGERSGSTFTSSQVGLLLVEVERKEEKNEGGKNKEGRKMNGGWNEGG